jgi:hypothetical protein
LGKRCDAREDCEIENERMKFQQMLADRYKLLYPGYADGLKKFGITLELLQWKATHGVSNKGFRELLKLFKKYFLRIMTCLPQHMKQNNLFAI